MSDEARSFWDAGKREAYLAEADRKADASQRLADGEAVAAQLDQLWRKLSPEERAVLLQMMADHRSSLIAQHDAPVLRDLVAKGLLQYPRGVGGSWMRNPRTTYRVAPAVWRELKARPEAFNL